MSTSASTDAEQGRRLVGGVPLREVLDVPALAGHRLLAGRDGLGRIIQGANVMEVPDILDWVKPHEFLVTTAYSLRHDPDQLTGLVEQLAQRGLAGLGIKLGRYVDRLPDDAVAAADAAGFAVVGLPADTAFSDLLHQVLTRILDHQSAALSGADLMYALIGRRLEDEDEIMRRATTMGWRLDRPLRLIVAEPLSAATTVDGTATTSLAVQLRQVVRDRDRHAAVVTLGDEAVVLCAEPDRDEEAFDRTRSFLDTACTAGVSRTCMRPSGVAEAYAQARRAATVGRQMHGPGSVTRFDDLGSLRLLSHVPEEELETFLVDVLGPILGDDEPSAILRQTLQALLEADGNVAETARRVHFHYNTVRARVARLEELLGPITTDHRRRVDVTLALQILQLEPASGSATTSAVRRAVPGTSTGGESP